MSPNVHSETSASTTEEQQLLERCNVEATTPEADAFLFHLALDLTSTLAIVGQLQLALRHPGNTGPGAQIARNTANFLIGGLAGAGLVAIAELARLGDNPECDV